MRVYAGLQEVERTTGAGRVVAIGVFDGVHRGHQAILRQAVEEAVRRGARSAVVTFHPHPEAVVRPRRVPRTLTSLEEKGRLLEGLGIDEMVVVEFDREFSSLSPEAFCGLVLSARLDARRVFVGENFRFGHQGAGTTKELVEYGRTHGFAVTSVPLVFEAGQAISSTRIREELRGGRVSEVTRLLGRPYRIEGEVVKGDARGRTLEAPTANLALAPDAALPRLGVYVTRSTVDGVAVHPSVTSVGTNPTFHNDDIVRVETILLDFVGVLYGSRLAVDFLKRIRPQRTFANGSLLAERIKKDVEEARGFHSLK
jgi:riboflavin kinase/FMN adenylyltransferase